MAKMINAAKLDAKLSSLVIAVDSIIFAPLIIMNAKTKKEPVPGPKNHHKIQLQKQ